MKRFLLINLILAFALVIQGWAQDRTVTGNVTSADDAGGLPAVNVILQGTTTGATTDVDGNYRLSVPSSMVEYWCFHPLVLKPKKLISEIDR